jgi:hypothetical protein
MRRSSTSLQIDSLITISRLPRLRNGKLRLAIYIFLALVLCFPVPAKSALVSGRVYDPNGNVVRNTTFIVQNAGRQPICKNFTTDDSGTYGVYLEPGEYFAEPKENKPGWEGVIRSYPQPVRQDIHLRVRGR